MFRFIPVFLLALLSTGASADSSLSGRCSVKALEAARTFAAKIVYPRSVRLARGGESVLENTGEVSEFGKLDRYRVYLEAQPSAGIVFDVRVEPGNCKVRGIEQFSEE